MTAPTFNPRQFRGFGFPIARAPIWKTRHQEAVSGNDNPLADWAYPRWRWTINFSILKSDAALEFQYIATFFNRMNGSFGVFAYDDPDDDTVSAQTIAVGDGATTTFQLLRTMPSITGEPGWTEPVGMALSTPTPTVLVAGVAAHPTFNDGGSITFGSPPANGAAITWTGKFAWLCRFDDDSIELSKFMSNWWSLGKMSFTSTKIVLP